jgi:hypothetical protein
LDASVETVTMHRIKRRNFNLFIFVISFNTGLNIAILTFY